MSRGWLLLLSLSSACVTPAADDDPAGWFAAAGQRAFACAQIEAGWVVVGGQPARQGQVSYYTLAGRCAATLRVGDDVAYCVDVRGERVAIGMADGRLLLATLPKLEHLQTCWQHPRPVVAVAWAPDGVTIASAGHDGIVRVGAATADAAFASLEHTAAATCVAWSSDGQQLASGALDGKVRLHTADGRLLRTWNRLGGEVVAVRWLGERIECDVRATVLDDVRRCLLGGEDHSSDD